MPNSNKQDKQRSAAATEDAEQTASPDVERELHRQREMYLRALADFENFRKRVERDRATEARNGKRDVLLSVLDVLDGFDRALEHAGNLSGGAVEGLQALQRQLIGVLAAQDVVPFNSTGERFDPELHEAVASVHSDQQPSGTIVDEVRRGYRWDKELLRPARVRVAQ